MKQLYFVKELVRLIPLLAVLCSYSQSRGDIAFTAINVDGDDDFALVVLADLSSNTTIYFTDKDWDELNDEFVDSGNDGFLSWSTGNSIIKAGTCVRFTDIDNGNNPNFGASVGKLESLENINLVASGETLFAYLGTDKDKPTTFIAGIKNAAVGTDLIGTGLGDTDLTPGIDFIEFNPTLHPDGGIYSGSRSSELLFKNYLPLLTDKSNWTRNTTDGEALLPHATEAFTTNTTSWTGAVSTAWHIAENWDNGIPTSASLVNIPDAKKSPTIKNGTTAYAGNINIGENQTLSIAKENALTVTGDLNGLLTLNSGSSLIVLGTANSELTYKAYITDTKWHFVSAPVVGEQYNNAWATSNKIDTDGSENNIAISTYTNSVDKDGRWEYFQANGDSMTFKQGQGYSLKRVAPGNYVFTGNFPTTVVKQTINQGFEGHNNWNLIGNPYPSYLKVSDLILKNTSNLTDTHESIYVWNGTDYMALEGTDYIHPGQGFFVNADNSDIDNFVFPKSLQSHQVGIVFHKKETPSIQLVMKDGDRTTRTKLVYKTGATSELDIGLDIGTFTGVPTSFNIYSHLVTNSQGVDFMRQTLPDNNYEELVVPIGIKIDKSINAVISANTTQLPSELNVYLEDKKTHTFTRLDALNATYKVSLTTSDNGIGRFYLHTKTAATLSTKDRIDANPIYVYATNKKTIRISGLSHKKANLKMYSIIGKVLINKSLILSNSTEVSIPNTIKPGIYIINITTERGHISKKVNIH